MMTPSAPIAHEHCFRTPQQQNQTQALQSQLPSLQKHYHLPQPIHPPLHTYPISPTTQANISSIPTLQATFRAIARNEIIKLPPLPSNVASAHALNANRARAQSAQLSYLHSPPPHAAISSGNMGRKMVFDRNNLRVPNNIQQGSEAMLSFHRSTHCTLSTDSQKDDMIVPTLKKGSTSLQQQTDEMHINKMQHVQNQTALQHNENVCRSSTKRTHSDAFDAQLVNDSRETSWYSSNGTVWTQSVHYMNNGTPYALPFRKTTSHQTSRGPLYATRSLPNFEHSVDTRRSIPALTTSLVDNKVLEPQRQSRLAECETCQKNHVGDFGSGRFCSSKCARTVGGIAHRKKRLAERGIQCDERGNIVPDGTNLIYDGKQPASSRKRRRVQEDVMDQQQSETATGGRSPRCVCHQYDATSVHGSKKECEVTSVLVTMRTANCNGSPTQQLKKWTK